MPGEAVLAETPSGCQCSSRRLAPCPRPLTDSVCRAQIRTFPGCQAGRSLRTMPPLSARRASSATKARSSAAPHFSLSVLLLLGVRGDENEWEENVYVFMISQSSAVSRSETASAHNRRLEGRWNLHWQEHSLPRFTHFCFGSVGGCMSKQPE